MEHLTRQIGRITLDRRSDDQQDTCAADDAGEDRLHNSYGLRTADIDPGDENRQTNGCGKPGRVYIKTGHRVQIALQECRPEIRDDRRKRARLKAHNTDISEDDRPGADKGSVRSHGAEAEHVLAAALRHGRCQLGVGQTDEEDHDTADHEAEHGADHAASLDPVTGGDNPSPSDHGAESYHKDIPRAENFVEFRLLFFHMTSSCQQGCRQLHRKASETAYEPFIRFLTPSSIFFILLPAIIVAVRLSCYLRFAAVCCLAQILRSCNRFLPHSFSISMYMSRYFVVLSHPRRLLSIRRSRCVRSPLYVPVIYLCLE